MEQLLKISQPTNIDISREVEPQLISPCASQSRQNASCLPIAQPIPPIIRPRKRNHPVTVCDPNYKALIPIKLSPKGYHFSQIYFSNVRSMTNKIDEISNLISLNSYDIIVITESWLNSDVTDNYVSQSGYKTFRRDRNNDQRGGGICTYIWKQLNIVEICDMNDPEVESQWFLIKTDRLPRGINTIILGTIYHPPRNDDRCLRVHIFKCLDHLLTVYPNSGILVLGDFNQFRPGNLCGSFKLKKIVKKPTRENILDQVYTNLSLYYESTILPPIGSSDHRSILLQPLCNGIPSVPIIRTQRRECKASNKRALISTLENTNWTPIYRFNSCEKQLEVFQSMISSAINFCLPMRSVKTYTRDKPWITPDIKSCIKKRQLAWERNDVEQYKIYRNKVAKLCKVARRRFYEDKIRYTNDINPKK